MQDYSKLHVWSKAHHIALEVHRATKSFPREERFELTSQVRRAAMAVPINIAEGAGRSSRPTFAHFLDIANGSVNELDYQLLLAKDLGYLSEEKHQSLTESLRDLGRMLSGFRRTLIKRGRAEAVRARSARLATSD